MSDELLSAEGEMVGSLVPFTPELLLSGLVPREKRQAIQKPVNWIPESNYLDACLRLQQA